MLRRVPLMIDDGHSSGLNLTRTPTGFRRTDNRASSMKTSCPYVDSIAKRIRNDDFIRHWVIAHWMNARNKENSHNYALCFFLSDTTASTARSTSGRTRKTCPPFVPTSHQSSYSTTRPALTDHTQVLMDSISPISLILCFFQGFTLMSDMHM